MGEADEALVARLARLETGVVSDVLDEAGFGAHAPCHRLRAVTPASRFAGVAACVRGEARVSTRAPAPEGARASAYAVERAARPGTVLVVATGGFGGGAFMGGLLARELVARGCRGLLTDGLVRDAADLARLGMPVVSAGLTPVNASRRWAPVEEGVPVTLPGLGGGTVAVRPGDLVLGDEDGVVVLPAEHASELIAMAEELTRVEAAINREMDAGAGRAEAFARHDRFAHVRWLNRPAGMAGD